MPPLEPGVRGPDGDPGEEGARPAALRALPEHAVHAGGRALPGGAAVRRAADVLDPLRARRNGTVRRDRCLSAKRRPFGPGQGRHRAQARRGAAREHGRLSRGEPVPGPADGRRRDLAVRQLSIPPGLWPAEADDGQIGQVVGNIVVNADQAMPEGGIIAVSAENVVVGKTDGLPLAEGRYVAVAVADRGPGIPREARPRIFDPYFTTRPDGIGLGLYTSYAIVKRHGGHIAVEDREGGGTVFRLYVPASDREPESVPERPGTTRGRGGRILLMEDDGLIAESVALGLRIAGFMTDRAADGDEAVRRYRRSLDEGRCYDLVIIDLTIPGGMGGKEAIKRLREMDRDVTAIVASGYSDAPVMSRFRDYGFKGMIPKPYGLEDLVRMVNEALADRQTVGSEPL